MATEIQACPGEAETSSQACLCRLASTSQWLGRPKVGGAGGGWELFQLREMFQLPGICIPLSPNGSQQAVTGAYTLQSMTTEEKATSGRSVTGIKSDEGASGRVCTAAQATLPCDCLSTRHFSALGNFCLRNPRGHSAWWLRHDREFEASLDYSVFLS